MKTHRHIATEIVDAINKTTNDYDAADVVEKILKDNFRLKDTRRTVNVKRKPEPQLQDSDDNYADTEG